MSECSSFNLPAAGIDRGAIALYPARGNQSPVSLSDEPQDVKRLNELNIYSMVTNYSMLIFLYVNYPS